MTAGRSLSHAHPPLSARLDWDRDGRDWPLRECSSFVQAGGLRWHVQQLGRGPVALLIHGTGAATHSWRGLAPLLAARFKVVAVDLPGHAFTEMPCAERQSLPGMAAALAALLKRLELDVDLVVGHSAGAAIALRLVLDGQIAPQSVISLNGALLPLGGLPGLIFPPVARLMAASSLTPRLFAWRAGDRAAVERLIAGTGSTLDARGVDLYARLVGNAGHAAAALAMMARWDLQPLLRDLPRLHTPLQLLVAANDKAVPPDRASHVVALLKGASPVGLRRLNGVGHLAHEERPGEVADLIFALTGTM